MPKARKIFIPLVLLVFSIPVFLFEFGITRKFLDEFLFFGFTTQGTYVEIDHQRGPSGGFEGTNVLTFALNQPIDGVNDTLKASYDRGALDANQLKTFREIEAGDQVELKVLSKHKAIILNWKDVQLQPPSLFSYLGWLLAWLILGAILYFVWRDIYRILSDKKAFFDKYSGYPSGEFRTRS